MALAAVHSKAMVLLIHYLLLLPLFMGFGICSLLCYLVLNYNCLPDVLCLLVFFRPCLRCVIDLWDVFILIFSTVFIKKNLSISTLNALGNKVYLDVKQAKVQ